MAVVRTWSNGSEWGTVAGTHLEVINYLSVSGLGPAVVHQFTTPSIGSTVAYIHANE